MVVVVRVPFRVLHCLYLQGVRTVSTSEEEALKIAASYVRRAGQKAMAKEVYQKLGDISSLMELHVEAREWKEAFALAQAHPGKFSDEVFLPYAEWLAIEDRFEEALVCDRPCLACAAVVVANRWCGWFDFGIRLRAL